MPGVRKVSGFLDNMDLYDSGTPVHGFSGGYAQPGVVGTGVMEIVLVVVTGVIPEVAAGAPATDASSAMQPAKKMVMMIPTIATIPNCAGFIRFTLYYQIATCVDPKTVILKLSSRIIVMFMMSVALSL
jgi:hypothetical protein